MKSTTSTQSIGQVPGTSAADGAFDVPKDFPLTLDLQQQAQLQSRLDGFNFSAVTPGELEVLGKAQADNLARVLDAAIARIEQNRKPALFTFVDALSESVGEKGIHALVQQYQSARPTRWHRFLGFFSSKQLNRGLNLVYAGLSATARTQSEALAVVVSEMDHELVAEMAALDAEQDRMNTLMAEYRRAYVDYCMETAFLHIALKRAQALAPALLASTEKDLKAQHRLAEKLEAFESGARECACAMNRMPAEHTVMRHLQSVGVSTLQELAMTMGDQFASIRMTLLDLLKLDRESYDKQAESLEKVVAGAANLQHIISAARESHLAKTEAALGVLTQAHP